MEQDQFQLNNPIGEKISIAEQVLGGKLDTSKPMALRDLKLTQVIGIESPEFVRLTFGMVVQTGEYKVKVVVLPEGSILKAKIVYLNAYTPNQIIYLAK